MLFFSFLFLLFIFTLLFSYMNTSIGFLLLYYSNTVAAISIVPNILIYIQFPFFLNEVNKHNG